MYPIIVPYMERGGGHPKQLYLLRVHVNVVCVSFVCFIIDDCCSFFQLI